MLSPILNSNWRQSFITKKIVDYEYSSFVDTLLDRLIPAIGLLVERKGVCQQLGLGCAQWGNFN
jgi:hypothetical protein